MQGGGDNQAGQAQQDQQEERSERRPVFESEIVMSSPAAMGHGPAPFTLGTAPTTVVHYSQPSRASRPARRLRLSYW